MNSSLNMEEQISIALRRLYMTYGYRPYKVSKFEKYELYMRNKNFLSSEQILTFTDLSGELMALKPDITLSVVKNTQDEDAPTKVFYAEKAYRVPRGAVGFKEITQTGLEFFGKVDVYTMSEVLMLAAKSLETISPDYALDISDMGVVGGILSEAELPREARAAILTFFGEKNLPGLRSYLQELGLPGETRRMLTELISLCGPLEETLPALEAMGLPASCAEAVSDLRGICDMTAILGGARINLDFSVVNDMGYYNGLCFVGFIDGVPASVLSGGRYDQLMRRMGRKSEAIGFAVYLDQLERFRETKAGTDVDALIVYDDDAQAFEAARLAREMTDSGLCVRVQRGERTQLRCGRILRVGEAKA